MKNAQGLLLVISGPSGVRKGQICRDLANNNASIQFCASATTRKKRKDEVDGKNYIFKSKQEFLSMIENDEFLEYMLLFNANYYGTPKQVVKDELLKGNDIILQIDYKGAKKVKQNYKDAVLIFIAPKEKELQNVRQNLQQNAADVLDLKIERIKSEFDNAQNYDYIVQNENTQSAVETIESIITSEKCKVVRNIELLQNLKTKI